MNKGLKGCACQISMGALYHLFIKIIFKRIVIYLNYNLAIS